MILNTIPLIQRKGSLMSIFLDEDFSCERQELLDARRKIAADLRAGRISKARHDIEMQLCSDDETRLDSLDCAYSDDY